MAQLRTPSRVDILAGHMDQVIGDLAHPTTIAFNWLKKQFRECVDRELDSDPRLNVALDLAPGNGRTLLRSLSEIRLKGTVYAVEKEYDMALKLMREFEKTDLDRRIKLVPMVMDASELLEREETKTIPPRNKPSRTIIANPFFNGKQVKFVIQTEAAHEFFSCPALERRSYVVGEVAYNKTLHAMVQVLEPGGLLFFQDLHGADANIYVRYNPFGVRGKVAEQLIKWIIDPNHIIPPRYLFQDQIEPDREYWTQDRRKLLTDLVTQNKLMGIGKNTEPFHIDLEKGKIPFTVLAEAAYRLLWGYADQDHEIHCGLTGEGLIKRIGERTDLGGKGMRLLTKHQVKGHLARNFLFNYGSIEIPMNEDIKNLPALYTAAVFRKQAL